MFNINNRMLLIILASVLTKERVGAETVGPVHGGASSLAGSVEAGNHLVLALLGIIGDHLRCKHELSGYSQS